MKIAIAGIGYVGLSNAVLLAQHHEVVALDVVQAKVDQINNKKSPIVDAEIEEYLATRPLSLRATTDAKEAFTGAQYVIISTPTNYDPDINFFDTSSVETVIQMVLEINPDAVMVIKSTVPVGYTKEVREKFQTETILFSPEFLREGRKPCTTTCIPRASSSVSSLNGRGSLPTCCWNVRSRKTCPSCSPIHRGRGDQAVCPTPTMPCASPFSTNSTPMRAQRTQLAPDHRGRRPRPAQWQPLQQPSFGYGGYCLPKDTKQLLANYANIPNNIMAATSMPTAPQGPRGRHDHPPQAPGRRHFRLAMKAGSDNFRILDPGCHEADQGKGIEVVVYEPYLLEDQFYIPASSVTSTNSRRFPMSRRQPPDR
jgi:UDPglucose 6-dehydrogenase